jgi:outer membrane receptor for monomeric catechols
MIQKYHQDDTKDQVTGVWSEPRNGASPQPPNPSRPKAHAKPSLLQRVPPRRGLIGGSSGAAQTTGSTSSARTSPVVELSPFVVNAEEDTGYTANSTLAGSRLKTDLIDTASAIDVLTPELLRAIGATSLDEAIELVVRL